MAHRTLLLGILILLTGPPGGTAWTGDRAADPHGVRPRPVASPLAAPAAGALRTAGGVPGVAGWLPLGPFGGDGAAVTGSPLDPDLLLVGLAPGGFGGGLYRSTDAGASFSPVAALDDVLVFDLEVTASGQLFAGTLSGLWVSGDGGVTWTPRPLGLSAAVYDVALDPADPDRVWLGVDSNGQGVALMRSIDGGLTFHDRTPPMSPVLIGQGVAFHPGDPGKVYACFAGPFGGGSVWFSDDDGASWTDRTAGLPNNPMYVVAHDGARLLVGGGSPFLSQFVGLYTSDDDGATWDPLHDGSWPVLAVRDLAIDPADPQTLLVATEAGGVHRTVDGGTSWEIGVGGSAGLTVSAVRFAPGSSTRVALGADSLAALTSTDGGDSFTVANKGINELEVVALDANPLDPDELAATFQSLNSGGVYTSLDGGGTWSREDLVPTRYDNARFAPDGRLYTLSTGPSTVGPEGLYRREDDGTWTHLGPDLGPFFESDLHALAFGTANPELVLAGGTTLGEVAIWRSPDGGDTWTRVYQGPSRTITDLAVVADGSDLIALGTFDALPAGGAVRSDDGGFGWNDSSTGLPADVQGEGLASPPSAPSVVYLADSSFPAGTGGVHRSLDGGQTWSSTGYTGEGVIDLVCDPADPRVLYAALEAFNGLRVVRSEDFGASFTPWEDGLGFAGASRKLGYRGAAAPELLFGSSQGAFHRPTPLPIFVDGFESGDLAAWSAAVPRR